jgi:hypothetical protein
MFVGKVSDWAIPPAFWRRDAQGVIVPEPPGEQMDETLTAAACAFYPSLYDPDALFLLLALPDCALQPRWTQVQMRERRLRERAMLLPAAIK